MATMKVAEVPNAGADFRIVEREIPKPGAGQVLIKVLACGVCHSDVFTKDGSWPGIQYPRVPGLRWRVSLMRWVMVFPRGRKGSALVSAGMADRMGRVSRAGGEILPIART